jgi:phage gp36-like protein
MPARAGLTNSTFFLSKFGVFDLNRIKKSDEFTVHKSKISKNQEKSEKYYKKLEKIPSILVKKFCKTASFGFFKIQISSNLHHFQISILMELVWFCC